MNDPYTSGMVCTALNCLNAVSLVRRGDWTLDTLESWCRAASEGQQMALSNPYPEVSSDFTKATTILSKCLGYLRTTEHKEDYVEACRLVGVDPFPKPQ